MPRSLSPGLQSKVLPRHKSLTKETERTSETGAHAPAGRRERREMQRHEFETSICISSAEYRTPRT